MPATTYVKKSINTGRMVRARKLRADPPRRRKLRLAKPVAAAVKAIVTKNQETKYISLISENAVAHNSAIGASDFYRIVPRVSVGTNDYSRIGDRIRPVSLRVRGNATLYDALANNKVLIVRVLLLQLKTAHQIAVAQAQWNTGAYQQLLKYNLEGGGTENAPFAGNVTDIYTPVNRELFDVLGERFLKLDGREAAAVESSPPSALSKSFNFKVKCPAQFMYPSTGDNDPVNFAPFLAVGYAYLDGTGPDVVTTNLAVTSMSHLYYKDA